MGISSIGRVLALHARGSGIVTRIPNKMPLWRNWLKRMELKITYPSGKRCRFESDQEHELKRTKRVDTYFIIYNKY
jgi:hypothetical protein